MCVATRRPKTATDAAADAHADHQQASCAGHMLAKIVRKSQRLSKSIHRISLRSIVWLKQAVVASAAAAAEVLVPACRLLPS